MIITHEHKVIGYVMGVMQRLTQMGLITMPPCVTPKGTAIFDQILADGFQPKEDEILMALTALENKRIVKFRNAYDRNVFKTLIVEYRPAMPH